MAVEMSAEPGISAEVRRQDVCALQSVRRVAAMLDRDPDGFSEGAALPCGWHFFLLGGDTRRSQLRVDGFPGFGVPMPDLGLPRLLLGGRTVDYYGDILIGSTVERISRIVRLDRKSGPTGPSAVMTLQHELRPEGAASARLVETQTYILLPETRGAASPKSADHQPLTEGRAVTPDDTLLFQYSSLGFNSHRIHLDRAYTREVEGLPDLVVNGGLVTLLATEFLREVHAITPRHIKTRHTAPLFVGRPITFVVRTRDGRVGLTALDDAGVTAMHMELDAQ